jgi:microcystin-dependent protein
VIDPLPALAGVIGPTVGGDGVTTVGLPDLRGCVLIGAGDGPGLDERFTGEQAGEELTSLGEFQLPPHVHEHVAAPAQLPLAARALGAGGVAAPLPEDLADDRQAGPRTPLPTRGFFASSELCPRPINR